MNSKGVGVSEKFSFTQKNLSDEIGIDVRTMQNYKKLTELIPELEDLVDTGILAPTTALGDDATIIKVMQWMLDIQLGRRNLSPIQRIAVAEKYRPIYERQAKENLRQASGGNRRSEDFKKNQGSQNSSKVENKIDVRAKLAQTASVSTDTYSKGKKILDSDNEELKKEVLSGEKTISKAYKELQNENKKVQSCTVITI
jgi:hypothetical protein